jgi:hypothetical protein
MVFPLSSILFRLVQRALQSWASGIRLRQADANRAGRRLLFRALALSPSFGALSVTASGSGRAECVRLGHVRTPLRSGVVSSPDGEQLLAEQQRGKS